MTGLAILGLDHWYWAYDLAAAARDIDGARLVGIWDGEQRRRTGAARCYGVYGWTDADEAIQHPDVDVVVITTMTDRHADLVLRAVQAGKSIICNKPLGRTLPEAQTIVEAVGRRGVGFQSIEQGWRHYPVFRRAKERVAAGAIGRVITVHTVTRAPLPAAAPDSSESGWFTDPARVAGGAFIDHGVYSFDLLSWLLDAPVERITHAEVAYNLADVPLETYGVAMAHFGHGIVGIIEETWFAPTFSITVEARGTGGELTAQVGREPVLELCTQADGRIREPVVDTSGPVVPALAAFLAALGRGENSSEGALRQMQLCLDAYRIAEDWA